MKIHKIIRDTLVEGSGKRLAIWVQGCSLHCEGCFNKELWSKDDGIEKDVNDILDLIDSDGVEGITIIGGEPFEQLDDLYDILKFTNNIKKNSIVFSGYTYKELLELTKNNHNDIFDYIDILIDGRYIKALKDNDRALIGSKNQNIIILSEDGLRLADYFSKDKKKIELRIGSNGSVIINGKW